MITNQSVVERNNKIVEILNSQYSQSPFTQQSLGGSQYSDRYALSQDSNYGSEYSQGPSNLGTQDSFLDGFSSTQGSENSYKTQQF